MNKFQKLISSEGDKTLLRRAGSLATSAEIAQQNLVNELKQQKVSLELKITSLTDLAPESRDSLRPGDKDWDAKQWVKDLQDTKQALYMLEIQLKLAQETYDEYFKEIKSDNMQ